MKNACPGLCDAVALTREACCPLQMLCDGGANPNAQNHAGRTPLHVCMPLGYSACVVHLYNAGAGRHPNFASRPSRPSLSPLGLCVRAFVCACMRASCFSQLFCTLCASRVPFPLASPDDTITDKDGKTALDQTSEDFGPQNY